MKTLDDNDQFYLNKKEQQACLFLLYFFKSEAVFHLYQLRLQQSFSDDFRITTDPVRILLQKIGF